MHNRDIFGQREGVVLGGVITPTNIIYREVYCSNCRSKLEAEGIVFIQAANLQTLVCPVCDKKIYLDAGRPPRRWSITRVLKRVEAPEPLEEGVAKPLAVSGIVFKEMNCPYYGSRLELKGIWDPKAVPSEIACPVCKKIFSYGPTAPRTLFNWIDGQPRKWELSRLIEAGPRVAPPLGIKWGTAAIAIIAIYALAKAAGKKR